MNKINSNFWKNKNILITGHTGFKGSWLTLWLLRLGAKVNGISLEPVQSPNLFNKLNLINEINHYLIDIRDEEKISSKILAGTLIVKKIIKGISTKTFAFGNK